VLVQYNFLLSAVGEVVEQGVGLWVVAAAAVPVVFELKMHLLLRRGIQFPYLLAAVALHKWTQSNKMPGDSTAIFHPSQL
jgi:hypothetical protein